MEPRRISELVAGEPARVRGRIRRGGALLTSPLGERPCVCWELRDGLGDDAPGRHEAVDFVLDDGSGTVVVRAGAIDLDARAVRREQLVETVERDLGELAVRQRALKRAIKRSEGDLKRLHAERRQLAELVTLLCAMRAHARSRVHVGGSLAAQQRWIDEHARAAPSTEGLASLSLVAERWEVALEEGDEIEVEGVCARELTASGGYRGQATELVLRAPPGGSIRVRGVGASAPVARPTRAPRGARGPAPRPPRDQARPPHDRSIVLAVAGLCGLGVLLAWWLS